MHFPVTDSRRRMFPLNVHLSGTVVIVVEVQPDSTSTTVTNWSPIELQQLRLAFPLSRDYCKAWSATTADWITTITTTWKSGFTIADYLLTEFEVCTEKYLPEVFVGPSEVCAEKTSGKYFPVQTEQTRLIRNLLYGFWFLSSSLLPKFCVHE